MTLLEHLPKQVSIYEVSPRDGLQNEAVTVPTHQKLRLIRALVDAGLERIELSSYVSPKWIPQLADADEVTRLAPRKPGLKYSALCPNEKGLERALRAGIDEVCIFMSASETHNMKNVNRTVEDTLRRFDDVIGPALAAGLSVRGYVSMAWGCPFEGDISIERVRELAVYMTDRGVYQVSLGDTIGVGDPLQTKRILEHVLQHVPAEKLALHCHDTRGTALANVAVGLEMGITTFDASVGGLGGCPYAPGSAGNVATEDLVYMLHRMGVETNVSLEKLYEAGQVARSLVGHELPGKVHRAGVRSLAH